MYYYTEGREGVCANERNQALLAILPYYPGILHSTVHSSSRVREIEVEEDAVSAGRMKWWTRLALNGGREKMEEKGEGSPGHLV